MTHRETYAILNDNIHHVNSERFQTLFPEQYPETPFDGNEYWHASDLIPVLYTQNKFSPLPRSFDIHDKFFQRFDFSPLKSTPGPNPSATAPYTCTTFYNHHVCRFHNKALSNPAPNNDTQLSRYAAYSLFRAYTPEGNDPFIQIYMIMPDSDFDTINNLANEYPRIKYRTEFTYIHKQLGGILSQFGINYAPFIHHMNEIFLDKHDATEIKIANGIKIRNDDPLANYMTLDTLREYTNAIANVVNHAGPRTSISQFRDHMVDSIRNARRRVIAKTGSAPEFNISRIQIQKVNNIIQRNHELFMAGYSKIYIK